MQTLKFEKYTISIQGLVAGEFLSSYAAATQHKNVEVLVGKQIWQIKYYVSLENVKILS